MPDFLTYYKSLKKREKKLLNDKIKEMAGIPYSTLYRKMIDRRFTKAEKIVLSSIIEQPVDVAFPEIPIKNLLPSYN